MSTPEAANEKRSDSVGRPRWVLLGLGLCIYLVVYPLLHGVVPWAVSLLTRRYGWTGSRPGNWNLLGLVGVIAGAACLLWVMLTGLAHWDRVPRRVKLGLTPPYLLVLGPYAYTRNPIYMAALALWLGWAIFYGSPAVFIGFMVLWAAVKVVVPQEERGLEMHFGETYSQYKHTVPRWLGRVRL